MEGARRAGELPGFTGNLGAVLARAGRLSGRLYGELLKPLGLTPAQAAILGSLESRGAAAVGELAAVWRVRAPVVTPMMRGLEERGYVKRRPDPEDGRRSIVVVTGRGRDVLGEVREIQGQALERVTAGLTEEESGKLREYLMRVIEALED
jgi:DNA-binding MarR family transcriptional regulator